MRFKIAIFFPFPSKKLRIHENYYFEFEFQNNAADDTSDNINRGTCIK